MTGHLIHASFGGPTLKMTVSGKPYYFEMHRFCGPVFTDKKGNGVTTQPGEQHLFWTHFDAWMRQGKKVENGHCVYQTDLAARRAK